MYAAKKGATDTHFSDWMQLALQQQYNNDNNSKNKKEKMKFLFIHIFNKLPCHPLHPYLTLLPSSFSTLPQHKNISDESYYYAPTRKRYTMVKIF